MKKKYSIAVMVCSLVCMANAAWYWPFGGDDGKKEVRMPELMEPVSALIDDAGDLAEWLTSGAAGNKITCISQFLNLNAMQMQELRVRFPRAFMKWTDDEDRALLSLYQEATAQGKKVGWGELARTFGRNTNALRLRLEHLGVDLGDEAGQPRRNRRN